jgi:hypothetical protein
MCLDNGTKYFLVLPSLGSMMISRLPRFTPPNVTTPSISVTTAGFDGLRASNNSVTRGRPPVISRVLPVERGILTITCPAITLSPLSTAMCAPTGMLYDLITSFLSRILIDGFFVLSLESIITFSL